ncbi:MULTISPECIES: hypothetical protein [Bacillus]|uniref:Uncharacterized protein n=2 Tax=Bacillaceae TaxID=186817 RepID=A0A2C3NJI3_9BACI|nr:MULTISPECIES: hypothetical protein [Bacillus cereus group]KMP93489.1 hypothetical protein TU65_18325 [Bacillus wiedmannii]MBX0355112.1 hypothetical protein [Bacillus toyonensis]MCU5518506.1 hypothetical protein [Bacillus wiedmannii]MCU5707726.1 hypothetical protein [Bacillus wiedmannii]MDM5257175.1 hypothetical protein [Bacillus toyonensis]
MSSSEIIYGVFAFGWIIYAVIITWRAKEYKRLSVVLILLVYMILIAFTSYFDFFSWKVKCLVVFSLCVLFIVAGFFEKEK